MGYYQSAYAFYGIHIPSDQWTEGYAGAEGEKIDSILRALGNKVKYVGHLSAGQYDNDRLFLVASHKDESLEVELGEYRRFTADVHEHWALELVCVAQAMGYTDLEEPSWIVVPDLS